MRAKVAVVLAVGGLALAAVPAVAHHAFSAEFDADRPIHLEGTITKMEWINPHAWIHLRTNKPDGTTEVWMVEGGTPNTLFRRGLTRDTLTVGTEIVVDGYQSKDGAGAGTDENPLKANGRNITFPDGRKLFLGSSGTGAPTDGADPIERPLR